MRQTLYSYDEKARRIVPVAIRMTDITGRVCVEYQTGRRDWISRLGVYADPEGKIIAPLRAAVEALGVAEAAA